MSVFEDLFGSHLEDAQGQRRPTAEVIGAAEVIGIYFSAHWCPPCRGFTPILANAYNKVTAAGKPFQLVFVSSDRDEASFAEYAKEMPWARLPYEDRDRKGKLSTKFKVQGIPTLVFLDQDGKTIASDGRSTIMEDPDGKNFPWPPPTFADSIGHEFERVDHSKVSAAELKGKVVGLYFSAHWCPPCRGFTPKLADVYQKVQKNFPDKFEIIFVSSDRDEAQFHEYHHTMPWLALPYADRDRKGKLSKLFDISGIPALVIVDFDTGHVINANARGSLAEDTEGTKFPWHPPAVKSLEDPDGINESRSVVVFAGAAPKEEQDRIETELTNARAHLMEQTPDLDLLFFLSRDSTGNVSEKVSSLTHVNLEKVSTVVLDIPDDGGFYVDPEDHPISAASIIALLQKIDSKAIARLQLGS